MFRSVGHALVFLAAISSANSCKSTSAVDSSLQGRVKESPATSESKELNFLSLGDKGATNFNKEITIYIDDTDDQFRGGGWMNVRIIYDGRFKDLPAGSPFPTHATISFDEECADATPPSKMVGIWRHPETASISGPIKAYTDCEKDAAKVELWGKKCLNPGVKECKDLEIKKSWRLSLKKLLPLEPVKQAEIIARQHK